MSADFRTEHFKGWQHDGYVHVARVDSDRQEYPLGDLTAGEVAELAGMFPGTGPVTMGHFDAIEGALTSAAGALERGAQTREWDSLQAAMGEAWADIQRAIGYARTLKARVPDGPGFEA